MYSGENERQGLPSELSLEVFQKNPKSRMRVGLACRVFGDSMTKCITHYASPVDAYASYILLAKKTNRFVDIMTAKKGCVNINSSTHPHVYELFDFVKFHHMWREQSLALDNRWLYLPESTYEDLCWTAIGTALIAMTHLPEGETMAQSRGGSDHLEESFCMAKNKNSCATALDTNAIMARNCSASFMSLYRSRKSNGEGRKVFSVNEVQSFKVRRPKIEHTARKPAAAVAVNRVVPQPQPQPPRQLPQEVQELVKKVASSDYHVQQIENVLFQAFDAVRVRMAEPEETRGFNEVAYDSYTEFFQDDSWFRNDYVLDYRQQFLWELPQLTRYIIDD